MLPDLSPHVERHRKGKGPKKDRCASYWDEDIWSGKDSPCTNAQGWREEDNLPHNEWEKDGKDLHHHQDTVEEKISGERKRSSGI